MTTRSFLKLIFTNAYPSYLHFFTMHHVQKWLSISKWWWICLNVSWSNAYVEVQCISHLLSIWIKLNFLYLVTKNHMFPIINGPIFIPWKNVKHTRTCLQLRNGLFCSTYAPNSTSVKVRLTLMLDNKLLVSNQRYFVVGDVVQVHL